MYVSSYYDMITSNEICIRYNIKVLNFNISQTSIIAELDYPRFLRPKFSTPKYRG